MLIEIPDDLARKAKQMMTGDADADTYRRWAEEWERAGQHYDAVRSLVSAALLEADLPEPIQVGHLAEWRNGARALVLAIDGQAAWLRSRSHGHYTADLSEITYAGPKPEGWGEQ